MRTNIRSFGALQMAQKGQDVIIEVTKRLEQSHPAIVLVLVGAGEDEVMLRKLAVGLDNVVFAGWSDKVGDYLAASDLFILPSYREGIGGILLDAMDRSLPVVATRVDGANPDTMVHIETLLDVLRGSQLMQLMFRPALPNDAAGCVAMRGKTRQNALTEEQLRAIGVTAKSWGENIASGSLPGHVCTVDESLVGYCFGSRDTGEIEVLAVLADFEGRGIGRKLLRMTVDTLATLGHKRVFLGCSKDPDSRSYGFYRHLGWRPTGSTDRHGDEILELIIDWPDAERSAAQTK